jgi:hypothetical protein
MISAGLRLAQAPTTQDQQQLSLITLYQHAQAAYQVQQLTRRPPLGFGGLSVPCLELDR